MLSSLVSKGVRGWGDRRGDIQVGTVDGLGFQGSLFQTDGFGGHAKDAQPHHDFVLGVGRTHGLVRVGIQEHVDGDVRVDVGGEEVVDIGGVGLDVTDSVGPVGREVDGRDLGDLNREDGVRVELDVGKCVDRLRGRTGRKLPRDGPLWCGGVGGIGGILVTRDLTRCEGYSSTTMITEIGLYSHSCTSLLGRYNLLRYPTDLDSL